MMDMKRAKELAEQVRAQNASAKRGHPKYTASLTSAQEYEMTTALLAAIARIEELEGLLGEACDQWQAWMTAEGNGPLPCRERLSEIRKAVEGGK